MLKLYFLQNRIYILHLLFLFSIMFSSAQSLPSKKKPKGNPEGDFANTQWWIGIKGGINLGRAVPTERYQVWESLDANTNYDKNYTSFRNLGFQFGGVVSYNFYKGISAVFAPEYSAVKYTYENSYQWTSPTSKVSLDQTHTLTHYYLNLPLMLKVDLLRKKFRPYVQGGIGYGLRTQSTQKTVFTSLDASSGGSNVIENNTPRAGVDNLFIRSQFYVPLGVGVAYDVGNVRLALEAGYRIGLSNISNRTLRYSDDRFVSSGDVSDDVKLQQIDIQLLVSFPMKFLRSSLFKSVNP